MRGFRLVLAGLEFLLGGGGLLFALNLYLTPDVGMAMLWLMGGVLWGLMILGGGCLLYPRPWTFITHQTLMLLSGGGSGIYYGYFFTQTAPALGLLFSTVPLIFFALLFIPPLRDQFWPSDA